MVNFTKINKDDVLKILYIYFFQRTPNDELNSQRCPISHVRLITVIKTM